MKTFRNPPVKPSLTGCRTCELIFLNICLPKCISKSLQILNSSVSQPFATPNYKLMAGFEGSCQGLLNLEGLSGH